jgi:putative membrane protein
MWSSALTAYGHYLGIMLIFAALATETLTLKKELTLPEAWRISIADAVYGLAATLVLVTGILRVLYFGKGADYYMHQPVFWAKVVVFATVSVLSIYPTVSFLRWIGPLRNQKPPMITLPQVNRLHWFIRLELLALVTIPLLATMMARNIGSGWFSIGMD